MNSNGLVLEGVSYAYRSDWSQSLVDVIKKISISIPSGEAFGFLGHNGAGKTTAIKCILGLCRIKEGSIQIFGRAHTDRDARLSVGYLPEQPYFYENLTVSESLLSYGALAGVSKSNLREKLEELLELFSLHEKKNAKMRTLSKGLMQRVGLAQAIIAEPKLLILDEPFSGLDPIGRKEFRDIILNLKRSGTTIFMSSHILNDVEIICDRASIMVRGEIKGIFNLRTLSGDLERNYELLVYLEDTDSLRFGEATNSLPIIERRQDGRACHLLVKGKSAAQESLKLLLENKFDVQAFGAEGSTLEKVFVDLVKGEK